MFKCEPTHTPRTVDIPAARAKYARERDKRLHPEGQKQYVQPVGELADNYAADPHMPVAARAPVKEDLEVAILGAGWTGVLAGYHLSNAGVTNIRHIDHATSLEIRE